MRPLVLLLIAVTVTSPLAAQDPTQGTTDSTLTPASPLYRDPHRALALGRLIPGAGHIYAREYWNGIRNYVGTVGLIGLGGMVFVLEDCELAFLSSCSGHSHFTGRVLGGAAIGTGILAWISTARDAPRAAERANIKSRCRTAEVKPIIEVPVGARGDWRAGISVRW